MKYFVIFILREYKENSVALAGSMLLIAGNKKRTWRITTKQKKNGYKIKFVVLGECCVRPRVQHIFLYCADKKNVRYLERERDVKESVSLRTNGSVYEIFVQCIFNQCIFVNVYLLGFLRFKDVFNPNHRSRCIALVRNENVFRI